MAVYKNLKFARLAKKVTLEELAKATGISVERLEKLERGEVQFTIDELKKLAKYYNVSLYDLIRESKSYDDEPEEPEHREPREEYDPEPRPRPEDEPRRPRAEDDHHHRTEEDDEPRPHHDSEDDKEEGHHRFHHHHHHDDRKHKKHHCEIPEIIVNADVDFDDDDDEEDEYIKKSYKDWDSKNDKDLEQFFQTHGDWTAYCDKKAKERIKKKIKAQYRKHKYSGVTSSVFLVSLLISIIVYLILGFTIPAGWETAYPIFFTPLILLGLMSMIIKRSASDFPIYAIAPFVYCIVGVCTGIWHPTWLIFFIIPLYYATYSVIRNIRISRLR